jgi:hypothetical protein
LKTVFHGLTLGFEGDGRKKGLMTGEKAMEKIAP